jgi:hypothetical protein
MNWYLCFERSKYGYGWLLKGVIRKKFKAERWVAVNPGKRKYEDFFVEG